jgi:hypothetical protein
MKTPSHWFLTSELPAACIRCGAAFPKSIGLAIEVAGGGTIVPSPAVQIKCGRCEIVYVARLHDAPDPFAHLVRAPWQRGKRD